MLWCSLSMYEDDPSGHAKGKTQTLPVQFRETASHCLPLFSVMIILFITNKNLDLFQAKKAHKSGQFPGQQKVLDFVRKSGQFVVRWRHLVAEKKMWQKIAAFTVPNFLIRAENWVLKSVSKLGPQAERLLSHMPIHQFFYCAAMYWFFSTTSTKLLRVMNDDCSNASMTWKYVNFSLFFLTRLNRIYSGFPITINLSLTCRRFDA